MWTNMDNSRQMWTDVDRCGQMWTGTNVDKQCNYTTSTQQSLLKTFLRNFSYLLTMSMVFFYTANNSAPFSIWYWTRTQTANMSVCPCLSLLSMFVHVCPHLSTFVCLCPSTFVHICPHLSTFVHFCLRICPHVSRFVHRCPHLSRCVKVCPFMPTMLSKYRISYLIIVYFAQFKNQNQRIKFLN